MISPAAAAAMEMMAKAFIIKALLVTSMILQLATSQPVPNRDGPIFPYMKCNRFPRVCRVSGSGGPDCCGNKCVDVETDSLNCWECGKKCGYGEACCRGTCTNIMNSRRNCGGCRKRCARGDVCRYGMCNYA